MSAEPAGAASAAAEPAAAGAVAAEGAPLHVGTGSIADATVGSPWATLDDIARATAGCTACPLHATARNAVPGEGNPDADFMIVGEAPGASEDESGRPFIGAAGQLLTRIIEAVGLTRQDIFICNVLKHRPPANRNPMPDEVRACSPYLVRQIDLVRPKVILALGTFAAQTLLDTRLPVGKLRGHVHRYHGIPLVVTYHPAALLRNPAWRRPTWDDVQLAHRVLTTGTADTGA
jgi:uracil-DNA glycosylase